ncbi:MAG: YdiU family protein [Alphaproteobacteria bacterium]|nr:YdiU family protein [Alphaproteobacteria bacterium]
MSLPPVPCRQGDRAIAAFRPSAIHAELGPDFFDVVEPARFPEHVLRYRNDRAAATIGLEGLSDEDWIARFGRFEPFEGSLPEPLALRYHGHQFDIYNPDLGDGRGFLYAQAFDAGGRLLDLGTKGSGQTPWSRGGDGRLTLKGGVREVLATSMLEALGVDTSKSLSLIETGQSLFRADEPSPARASVLVRLSHSHIRIGSFQRLAHHRQHEAIARLVRHCTTHYLPDARRDDPEAEATAFLVEVIQRVAETGARWISAGFVHGVLNSDNINITGESFDYGPWRFLPVYDPGFTAAYFDGTGLYAFGRQPDALAENLVRLAEALAPIGDPGSLEAALNTFWPEFQARLERAMLDRLGLEAEKNSGLDFVTDLLRFLGASQAPFEQVMFDLFAARPERLDRSPLAALYGAPDFAPVREKLFDFAVAPGADPEHAYFRRDRPRGMLIDEMEALWAPIAESDDWWPLHQALAEIAEMGAAYAPVFAGGPQSAEQRRS